MFSASFCCLDVRRCTDARVIGRARLLPVCLLQDEHGLLREAISNAPSSLLLVLVAPIRLMLRRPRNLVTSRFPDSSLPDTFPTSLFRLSIYRLPVGFQLIRLRLLSNKTNLLVYSPSVWLLREAQSSTSMCNARRHMIPGTRPTHVVICNVFPRTQAFGGRQ